jgi:hypothetical protein
MTDLRRDHTDFLIPRAAVLVQELKALQMAVLRRTDTSIGVQVETVECEEI